MSATYVVRADLENNSDLWWDTARQRIGSAPLAVRPLLDTKTEEVRVSAAEAAAIEEWAAGIPGWSDGDAPSYAPHPLVIYTMRKSEWGTVKENVGVWRSATIAPSSTNRPEVAAASDYIRGVTRRWGKK